MISRTDWKGINSINLASFSRQLVPYSSYLVAVKKERLQQGISQQFT